MSGRPGANPKGQGELGVRRSSGLPGTGGERFGLVEGREVSFLIVSFEAKGIKTKLYHIPGTFVEEG